MSETSTPTADMHRTSDRIDMNESRPTDLPAILAGSPGTASGVHGTELSVTGRWDATDVRGHGPKRSSDTFRAALEQLEAADTDGVSTEIQRVIGAEAAMIHRVFADADSLRAAMAHPTMEQLRRVATPRLQMVRGVEVSDEATSAFDASTPTVFGDWIYGYERPEALSADPATAVQVTAKWACTDPSDLDELRRWWQEVGTTAHELEDGLVRFEGYQVPGEAALVIHETFRDSAELKFHLTKGTAAMFKKQIDAVATPAEYYFRGPVAWSIRTYSKFMRLPATYVSGPIS